MPQKPGKKNPPHPEKEHHTEYLNDVLTDALKEWESSQGPPNVIIQFEATITANPGGVSQYRCRLVPGPPPD
jgi:hypothetical protein